MNKYTKIKRKRKIIIFFLVFLGFLIVLDVQLRPIIKTISVSKARVISTNSINEAVLEEVLKTDADYSSLVSIERGDNGKVVAITTNTRKVNELRSNISVSIQDKLSQTKMRQVGLPLGTLTGIELFNGIGPMVPLHISITGSVVTELTSKFSEAGINQTKHQIFIDVHTKISAMIPGYPATTTVDTNIPIAETVIVGEVPNVYASSESEKLKNTEDLKNLSEE